MTNKLLFSLYLGFQVLFRQLGSCLFILVSIRISSDHLLGYLWLWFLCNYLVFGWVFPQVGLQSPKEPLLHVSPFTLPTFIAIYLPLEPLIKAFMVPKCLNSRNEINKPKHLWSFKVELSSCSGQKMPIQTLTSVCCLSVALDQDAADSGQRQSCSPVACHSFWSHQPAFRQTEIHTDPTTSHCITLSGLEPLSVYFRLSMAMFGLNIT